VENGISAENYAVQNLLHRMADGSLKRGANLPISFLVDMCSVFTTINYLLLTMLDVPFYSNVSRIALNSPEGQPT
jgi:hypothetical protein